MRKNIKTLRKKLELIKKKLEHSSTSTNFYYKILFSKKSSLEKQIANLLSLKNKVLNTYSVSNEIWLYDDYMDCATYCKLEQRATYVRDKQLYKLGFLNRKPLSPTLKIQNNLIIRTLPKPNLQNLFHYYLVLYIFHQFLLTLLLIIFLIHL